MLSKNIQFNHTSGKIQRTCNKIYEILESCKVNTGTCNMISMKPSGKYNVNQETLTELWDLYSTVYNKIPLSLAEIPKEISYLKIDIDLDTDTKPKDRLYKYNDIEQIVEFTRQAANKYLQLDKSDMIAYIMEKENYDFCDNKYRDGFHIAFPFIVQTSKIRNAIFDELIFQLEKNKIFTNFNKPVTKIVDKNASIGKTPWLLLGGSKPNSTPYHVTKIINYKNKSLSKLKKINAKKNIELLSLLNNELVVDNCTHLNNNISMEDVNKQYQQVSYNLSSSLNLPSSSKDTEIAQHLIKMLSVDRASNYEDWIRVGYCLYNIDRTLLNEWINFSKLCPSKFKKGECENLWKKMKSGQNMYTIRSLHRWAKEDNYLDYNTFKNHEYNNLFKLSLTGDHQNIANAIYSKYQTEFVCSSIKNKVWYQYNYSQHKWEKIENGYALTSRITNEFVNEYLNLSSQLYQKATEAEPSQKMDILKEVEKIQGLVNRLNNESFLSTLMTSLSRRFYLPKFAEDLDEKYDLIGFNNGVFDLKKGIFRNGHPEDYLTMTTGLDYQQLDTDSEEYIACMKLFEDIHPDVETREYVYTLFSTFISGHHKEETLHLFNGCGSNGKSVTFELLKYCLGDYIMSVPVTLLTRKRAGSENATPMLAQLKGKRLGVLQEPEEGEKLHVGLMKELTGNDEITARPMFESPITFKPQIKFAIPCNNLPEVPARDKGTWRRLRVIDHLMEFVDKPNQKYPNQKQIDRTLKEKLEGMAGQFMSFLIDRYINVYVKKGMKVPNSVTFSTNVYNQDNNCIKQFCESKFEVTGKKTDTISQKTIWEEFKQYFKEEQEGNKRPIQREFYSYLDKTYGQAISGKGGKKYCGIIFSGDDEENEDVDL
ncbi:putative VV D5-type primase/helicase [Cafeteria roenbergensis virus]|uniref:Putative VV D5-type primase/helicase n=1 Tax=Cafeteria roenbergensis virus (strain BV-PW1) TaxID=693272 RepID=E3T5R5_CROVB|nr:DNA primase [Cafeteria roenbergensis virus BV-PW1]ADO67528.1 putative VV D5-type primase/helicase [Cafeteria roenbergensis virus BV-PW1]